MVLNEYIPLLLHLFKQLVSSPNLLDLGQKRVAGQKDQDTTFDLPEYLDQCRGQGDKEMDIFALLVREVHWATFVVITYQSNHHLLLLVDYVVILHLHGKDGLHLRLI